MTTAVLLSQGNELTTGQTLDTNGSWLAGRLWEIGILVRRVITAPDDLVDLCAIVGEAAELAPIVVCTGGLGPTRDDLTAEAVSRATGVPLEEHPMARQLVEAIYTRWGRPMAASNLKQALLPQGSRVLENNWGTAPGFQVDFAGSRLYFLPGVPHEMRPIFDASVLPDIKRRLDEPAPHTHIIRVIGVPESVLEERLRGFDVPGLAIGFRAAMPENQVKLRFENTVEETVRAATVQAVCARIGPRAFGVDSGDLAQVVGEMLAERGETLALAESCTAGKLAAWIATAPGASRYLLEGAVVYSNEAKVRTCGVDSDALAAHGAVSEPVARQLAEGIRKRAGASWGIGITGIAGPTGGSPEKPVGTVHLAVTGPSGTVHRSFQLPGDRNRITTLATGAALAMLHRALSEDKRD